MRVYTPEVLGEISRDPLGYVRDRMGVDNNILTGFGTMPPAR